MRIGPSVYATRENDGTGAEQHLHVLRAQTRRIRVAGDALGARFSALLALIGYNLLTE